MIPNKQMLENSLAQRFDDAPKVTETVIPDALVQMAGRGSCRQFEDRAVPKELTNTLCAVALSSPSKSDLQQRDIIILHSASVRNDLADLVPGQAWVRDAPMLAVFCGNNRRQRLMHDWHNVAFANDHLDAFFNAVGDAAIALGAFVAAAEASGLGCCPISAVRNEARAVSDLLALPPFVFPFAGLAFGYPASDPDISQRLPLGVTCHEDRYSEQNIQASISAYDAARGGYPQQRMVESFGTSESYGWSEDKVRQYSVEERADFAQYVRDQGFRL